MYRFPQVCLCVALSVAAVMSISVLESNVNHNPSASSFWTTPVFAASHPAVPDPEGNPAAAARLSGSYGKLPLSFEANQGQSAGVVQYLARGRGYTLFLAPGEMVLSLHASPPAGKKTGWAAQHSAVPPAAKAGQLNSRSAAIRMRLIGSDEHARVTGEESLPGKSNYFIGNDPAQWHTDIPTFARVRYSGVYPGVDLVYYGNQDGKLEHDFVIAPGADPSRIAMDLGDRQSATVGHDGSLRLATAAGNVTLQRPVVYQTIAGKKTEVSAEYAMSRGNRVGFRLGSYDHNAPLIIDPVLDYASVFGGSIQDEGESLTVDSAGEVYVVGVTYDTDFPVVDAYQPTWTPSGSPTTAGFVSKLNASGTALLYSTYLGGPFSEITNIVLDASGRIYLSGDSAAGFPVKNAAQPTFGGGFTDAVIAVLSPTGNSLEWSTYLGGSNEDFANAIAVDPSGNVYAAGFTGGPFPELHSVDPAGASGAWVAKFNSSGVLQYSSVVGDDAVGAMAVDATGAVYITGYGYAPGTPITPGALKTQCTTRLGCAYAIKVNPSGDSLAYGTFLSYYDSGATSIALDSDLNAYIGGVAAPGFPVWKSAFQPKFGGGNWDGFVGKLNSTGTNFIWSTYLGGNGDEVVYGLALDQHRQVFVDGWTCSSNFPLKDPIQAYTTDPAPNNCQFFVTTLSGNLGSIPFYSTYFGTGFPGNGPLGIAVDSSDNVYLAGTTVGSVHPTPGAFSDSKNPSAHQVFVAKLSIMDDLALAMSASPTPVAHGGTLTYNIAVTGKGPDLGTNVRISDTLPAGTTFLSYNGGGGSCTAPAVGATGTLNCALPQLNPGGSWTVALTVQVNAASGSTLSNTAATLSNMQDTVISNNSSTVTTAVN